MHYFSVDILKAKMDKKNSLVWLLLRFWCFCVQLNVRRAVGLIFDAINSAELFSQIHICILVICMCVYEEHYAHLCPDIQLHANKFVACQRVREKNEREKEKPMTKKDCHYPKSMVLR